MGVILNVASADRTNGDHLQTGAETIFVDAAKRKVTNKSKKTLKKKKSDENN